MTDTSRSKFISYFAVVGLGEQSVELPKDSSKWESLNYKPVVENRYPTQDIPQAPLPEHLPLFCLPGRVAVSKKEKEPTFFCITLTELTGDRFYGAVLTFHERLDVARTSPLLDRSLTVSNVSLEAVTVTTSDDEGTVTYTERSTEEPEEEEQKTEQDGDTTEAKDSESSAKTEKEDSELLQRETSTPTLSVPVPRGRRPSAILTAPPISDDVDSSSQDLDDITLYVPRCLCILSRHPYFSTFRECLRELYLLAHSTSDDSMRVPIERYIAYLLNEVPLPTPGGTVQFQLLYRPIICTRPPRHAFPSMDFCGRTLFRCLGTAQVLQLFASVLAEQKIIFTSRYYTMLTIAADTITQLLLPFHWHHIFIPILPQELLGFVEAPTPYIIGVDSAHQAEISNICGTTLVDLDKGVIHTSERYDLPGPMKRMLEHRMQEILEPELLNMDAAFATPASMPVARSTARSTCAMKLTECDNLENTRIRLTFLQFFVDLFKNYRDYISFLRRYPEPITIFNKALYLKEHPEADELVGLFIDSQAFSMFLHHDHQNPDTVFDEVIRSQDRQVPEIVLWQKLSHEASEFANIAVPPPTSCGWRKLADEGALDSKVLFMDPVQKQLEERWEEVKATRVRDVAVHGFPSLLEDLYPMKQSEKSAKLNQLLREKSSKLDRGSIKKMIAEDETASPKHTREKSVSKPIDTSFIENGTKDDEEAEEKSAPPSAEEALIMRSLRLIIESDSVPDLIMLKLDEKLATEQGRVLFARHLLREGGQGTIRDLSPAAHAALVEITRTALHLSYVHKEFDSPSVILKASGCYRLLDSETSHEEFLHEKLRDMDIWKDRTFWDAAFFHHLAQERRSLPATFMVGSPESQDWETMRPEEQANVKTRESNLLFGLLGNFAFHMLNTDIAADHASGFLQQMSRLCALEPEQTTELLTLWNNMRQINAIITIDEETSKREADSKKSGKIFSLENFTTASAGDKSGSMDVSALAIYRNIMKEGGRKALPANSSTGDASASRMTSYSMATLRGHSAGVSCMALHYPFLVSGSVKGEIKIWDVATGTPLVFDAKTHTDSITGLIFLGEVIIAASSDSTMSIIDYDTRVVEHHIKQHTGPINGLAAIGAKFVSGSSDKTVRVWDVSTGECEVVFLGHDSEVTALFTEQSKNAALVFSGDKGGEIRIWDVTTESCLRTIPAHADRVLQLSVTPHGYLMSLGADKLVRAWDLATGSNVFSLEGQFSTFKHNDSVLVAGTNDCEVVVWEVDGTRELYRLKHENGEGELSCLVLNDATREVIAGGFDCSARVWNYRTGQLGAVLASHTDWVYALDVHVIQPDASEEEETASGYVEREILVVTASWDRTIKLWKRKVMVKRKTQKAKKKAMANKSGKKGKMRLESSRLSKMIKKTFV